MTGLGVLRLYSKAMRIYAFALLIKVVAVKNELLKFILKTMNAPKTDKTSILSNYFIDLVFYCGMVCFLIDVAIQYRFVYVLNRQISSVSHYQNWRLFSQITFQMLEIIIVLLIIFYLILLANKSLKVKKIKIITYLILIIICHFCSSEFMDFPMYF